MTAEHYFSAHSDEVFELRNRHVEILSKTVTVSTAPGVFSPDHIDGGTAVLLRKAPKPPATGNFLDLGSGWGPIALTLAAYSPGARVFAVDVNERALKLVRLNAESLGLSNIEATLPDDIDPGIQFDLIWSNPPIRIGKEALHNLLNQWLSRLKPTGVAVLVVQRNLGAEPLTKWLNQEASVDVNAEKIASSKGFQILQVTRR
jgi:16S rRNA G1207 methylase RsmC